MYSRRFWVTGILVIVFTLCLAAAAAASSPGDQAPQGVPDLEVIQQGYPQVEIGQAASHQCIDQPALIPAGQNPVLGVESAALSAEEQQMLDLVNKERAAAGKGLLKADSSLVKLARLKASDMVEYRYFDHNSPTYGSPFDMMKKFGISYSFAGENLAKAPSVASAHKALMESPGHRANILNGNFDRVGIGIVVSGGYRYCVQLFTGGQREIVPVPEDNGRQPDQSAGDPTDLSSEESLMLQLINQERARAGVPRLVPDSLLFKVARLKARDLVENNYFSHTSPAYGTVRDMLDRFGVEYTDYSENLALSTSAARAHAALMRSPGNKANILRSGFDRVGIGIAARGSYKYFVQIYIDGGPSQPPSGGTEKPPAQEQPKPPSTGNDPGQPGNADPDTSGLTADEQRMLSLINAERSKYGLDSLKANLKLTGVARLKARDMIEKNYFSHTSPTYGSPFDMMRQFGVTYRTAGENLAGAPSVDIAHTNLMNSPGHRANILNGSFKEVGIGILSGSQYGKIFVQMFIG